MPETLAIEKPPAAKFELVPFLIRAANVGGLALIIVFLVLLLSSLTSGFLSPFNLFTLTRNLAIDTVIGFAMMTVLALGHMNLAVGAIGVSAIMFTGFLLEGVGLPIPISMLGGLAMGAFLGWGKRHAGGQNRHP